MRDKTAGAFNADGIHGFPELLTVFRAVDHVGLGTNQFHAMLLQEAGGIQRHGGVQRRLAAHGGQNGVGLFLQDNAFNAVRRNGLHIGGVRKAGVRHDGGGVGVHQNNPVAFFPQALQACAPE